MDWDKDLIALVNNASLPEHASEYITTLTAKLHYLVRRGLRSLPNDK